jgi:1,4-alpha-glucan branching enzyme
MVPAAGLRLCRLIRSEFFDCECNPIGMEAMMSTKKQYFKDKPLCKVTFRLNKKTAGQAKKAFVAADFNAWQADETPMKPLKNGDFTVTVTLSKGREYQYRYVLDGGTWITDEDADKYVPAGIADVQNAVVVV